MAGKYQRYPEYKDSGIDWLGKIPSHWNVLRLKHLAQIRNGHDYKSVEADEGVPVYGSGGHFTYSSTALWSKPSVLLGRKGTIDKPLLVEEPFWTVDTMFYTIILEPYTAKFVFYLARSIQFNRYLTNTALPSMTQESLANYAFAVSPSESERNHLVSFLDHETAKIDALIEKQQRLIELLKEKRQAAISHAVTKGLNPDVPMKDSGIEWLGEVPEHWEVAKIKHFAKVQSGHTPNKKVEEYWQNCTIPWVSLNDSKQLKRVDYISETAQNISELGMANSSARLLPEKAVVFTRDASIGLSAITTRPMAVSQHVIAWICKDEYLIPEYLLLVFYALEKEFERYTFGATIKTIGMDDVYSLTAAFPSKLEQQRIVEKAFSQIRRIDESITKAESMVILLTEKRVSLISSAVTGKIDVRNWQPANKEVSYA